MRLRLFVGLVLFFLLIAVSLAVVLNGSALFAGASAPGSNPSAPTPTGNNKIIRENALLGTTSWQIPQGKASTIQIQAYANATSVAQGEQLSFYVSTLKEGTPYWLSIYRLGWYGGYGGRLLFTSSEQTGHAQGYFNEQAHQLVNCTSCLIDSTTGLVESRWNLSYNLTVPSNWITGVYLAKFTDAKGMQTYVPFDVRDNSASTYLVATPDTTYAAYNDWGGYSLYEQANGLFSEGDTTARGVKVSFDRPYTQEAGSSQVLVFEANAIRWFERQGYDLSYISDIDLQHDPSQVLHHHAYIALGHDEYWSKEMRDGLEQARNSGVGLAFLGADDGYWQIRFEPDKAGVPDRTIVCYKVQTIHHDLARDPFYGVDNSRLTAQWRDPALGRPENALIGIMYDDLTHLRIGFPWQIEPASTSPLLAGTGLTTGVAYGCDIVGYEWDRVFNNGSTPSGLQVIATSHTANDAGTQSFSNTTYYIASSGALVFAAGSIYWTDALDNYHLHNDPLCTYQSRVVPGIQQLMAHVMAALAVLHPNHQVAFASTAPGFSGVAINEAQYRKEQSHA